mmetsp:Transcript_30850/g.60377  ORF Transcript_30850/g.60377 Transcript_30850/m.60377 type:complete len:85 (-) Transcript_30850:267-521(-)
MDAESLRQNAKEDSHAPVAIDWGKNALVHRVQRKMRRCRSKTTSSDRLKTVNLKAPSKQIRSPATETAGAFVLTVTPDTAGISK